MPKPNQAKYRPQYTYEELLLINKGVKLLIEHEDDMTKILAQMLGNKIELFIYKVELGMRGPQGTTNYYSQSGGNKRTTTEARKSTETRMAEENARALITGEDRGEADREAAIKAAATSTLSQSTDAIAYDKCVEFNWDMENLGEELYMRGCKEKMNRREALTPEQAAAANKYLMQNL